MSTNAGFTVSFSIELLINYNFSPPHNIGTWAGAVSVKFIRSRFKAEKRYHIRAVFKWSNFNLILLNKPNIPTCLEAINHSFPFWMLLDAVVNWLPGLFPTWHGWKSEAAACVRAGGSFSSWLSAQIQSLQSPDAVKGRETNSWMGVALLMAVTIHDSWAEPLCSEAVCLLDGSCWQRIGLLASQKHIAGLCGEQDTRLDQLFDWSSRAAFYILTAYLLLFHVFLQCCLFNVFFTLLFSRQMAKVRSVVCKACPALQPYNLKDILHKRDQENK